jgi:DMSO/TMAO reductase YedYZ molybdopterin-dependent catalytic subunit
VAEAEAQGGAPDPGHQVSDDDKPIGRRAFLGLVAAGVVAFAFGRDALSRVTDWLDTGSATGAVYKPQPVDLASWHLTVQGLVHKPLNVSWSDLVGLPQTETTLDFRCIDGWRTQPRRWGGVRLSELLDLAGVDEKATHVIFHSADVEYTDSLTIAQARADDVLLAHTMDGEPLTQDHGRPVRAVTPGRYGYKYVKWLTKIELIAAGPQGYQGYYEKRGYSVDASLA